MQPQKEISAGERQANRQALTCIAVVSCASCVLIAALGVVILTFAPVLPTIMAGPDLEPASPRGPILYVSGNGSGWRCDSWRDPCSLQNALATAAYGDEIWVKAGVYRPADSSAQPEATFRLKDGVEVYGGFAGTETSRDQRDWKANVTVLSGDLGGDDSTDAHGLLADPTYIVGRNSFHVVTGSGVTPSAVLDGFTITAGYANMPPPNNDGFGGGMFNWKGSPTLNNLVFSGNTAGKGSAYYGGGGMFNIWSSSPTLNHVTFIGNTAGSGGAMYNHASNPTLKDVTFSGNEAFDGSCINNYMSSSPILDEVVFDANVSTNKGCMINQGGSTPTLTHVTFSGNSARYGAGMYNYQSSPKLTDVVFTKNAAAHVGGAIDNEDHSSPTLSNVLFSGNSAYHEGGAIFNAADCDPILTSVAFVNNTVIGDGGGGAIKTYNSSPRLTNVTFSGNHAVAGGAIDNWQSHITLLNVTFSGNTADRYGSAMYSQQSAPTLMNTIIWGNTPGDSQLVDDTGQSTVSHSIVAGGPSGNDNQDVDPQLGALENGEGSLPYYSLSPGSPAIDAGSRTTCPVDDQLGQPRPVDGNGSGSAVCDMGAFEYQGP